MKYEHMLSVRPKSVPDTTWDKHKNYKFYNTLDSDTES